LYSLNGVLYAVVGKEFRIYNDLGGYHKVGTLNTSTGRVSIIANDTQILINDFQNGYVYQLIETSTRKANTFFRIANATSFISSPSFAGTGVNDLTINGNYTGDTSRTYKVQIDGSSSPYISPVVFIGVGVNDMSTSGVYTSSQTKLYRIEIDGSAGGVDTFRWSDSNGSSWNVSNVQITGDFQTLNDGVSVKFIHTTTHTISNAWTFTAFPAALHDTFRWSQDNGSVWESSAILITGGLQTLNNGIQISFLHLSGHTKDDTGLFPLPPVPLFIPPLFQLIWILMEYF